MAEFACTVSRHAAWPLSGLVEQVDYNVGRVLCQLDEKGLSGNTLVIVASDNGGTNKQIDNNAPYFGTKASFYEGGVRTPMIIRWPDKVTRRHMFTMALFPTSTICRPWLRQRAPQYPRAWMGATWWTWCTIRNKADRLCTGSLAIRSITVGPPSLPMAAGE